MTNYASLLALIQSAKPKANGQPATAYKVAPNVSIVSFPADSAVAVRLYETDILTFHAPEGECLGTFTASNGGWPTPTTIRWLNEYAPDGWRFCHRKGILCRLGADGEATPVVEGWVYNVG